MNLRQNLVNFVASFHYSYANTSRTVNLDAFLAGRKLATVARIDTITNQVTSPVLEKV